VNIFVKIESQVQTSVPMWKRNTLRVGGNAAFAYSPSSESDLVAFLQSGQYLDSPFLILGLGSNLLVRDGGFPGLVIYTHRGLSDLRILDVRGEILIYASAGVPVPKLARFAATRGCDGGEFMAGVPGPVGGALTMNAGCYGRETWDHIESVKTVTRDGIVRQRPPSDFSVSYRCVKPNFDGKEFFLGGTFRFSLGESDVSREKIKDLLRKRVAEQPLGQPNCGSVFQNPNGHYAARLIEECGFKGRSIGGASVSTKHANFIVNCGGATGWDVENLMIEIKETVKRRFKIDLETEVRIVGESL